MRSTFASKYNEVSAEKKALEDQLNELAGKFILRLTHPFLTFGSAFFIRSMV